MDETKKDDAVVAETPVVEEKKEEVKEEVKKEVPAKFAKMVEEIEKMSVLDLHELVKIFEERFGVSASAVAVAGPASADASAGAEEKSTFTVELTDAGAQKIAIIKIVKEVLALGLKDAKDKVDAAPIVLVEGMKKEEAENLKKAIEEAGGKVTLK
jgi:large subunit ribosomal protein L7/L12